MGGPVDDDMANLIVAQLLYLDSADQQKDITMYVNSPGGSVTAGGLDWLVAGCVGWLVFGWLAGRHTNSRDVWFYYWTVQWLSPAAGRRAPSLLC